MPTSRCTKILIGKAGTKQGSVSVQELEITSHKSRYSLNVLAAGIPVKAPISLISPGQVGHSLTMDRQGVSKFTPSQSGFYVAICHFRRQTASYSFYTGD